MAFYSPIKKIMSH